MDLNSDDVIDVNGMSIKITYVSPRLSGLLKKGFNLACDSPETEAIVDASLKKIISDGEEEIDDMGEPNVSNHLWFYIKY